MRNMENDKNHTVEHFRWVCYTEKHILWKWELCISKSYNVKNKNDKTQTVEHIRWVSYTEKHIRWKRELCISMSCNVKNKNDKNQTVDHIRWVSYTEKHIRWKRDLCISMSSYNEKHWKTNSLETGFLYINELQWEKWKMIKTTL